MISIKRKQHNYYVSFISKSKKLFYTNVDVKKWQIMKLFGLPSKRSYLGKNCNKIETDCNIIEKDEVVESEIKIVLILNTFFSDIVSNLQIVENSNSDTFSDNVNNPVKIIVKYRNYPNILCNRQQQSFFRFGCR